MCFCYLGNSSLDKRAIRNKNYLTINCLEATKREYCSTNVCFLDKTGYFFS